MTALFGLIEGHPLVRTIVMVPGLYPSLSALHILGIGALFGAILAVDLRLLRILGPALDPALRTLVHMAICAFALVATTGLLLAAVRIGNYAANPAFLTKMGIVAAAGLNAVLLRVTGGRDIAALVGSSQAIRAALLSMTLWIGAVFAGRWIAFV